MQFLENRKVILFLGCLCIFFPGAFIFGFPGVMASEWQALFNANKAQVTRSMFYILAGTGCSMYLAGKLQEKLHIHYIMFSGTLACALGMIGVAYVQSMSHVYLWAFGEGFFCGFVYLPALSFFQKMFPEHKGWVTGILNLTFGGAAALMSPVFTWFLVSKGYGTAAWSAGGIALVLSAWAALFIRMPENQDENMVQTAPSLNLMEIFRLSSFWFLWWIWAFAGAAGVSLIILASSYGEYRGYDITRSVYILTSFNILNGIGRLVCGRLSDIYSKTRILQVVFLMAALAYGFMPWSGNLYLISFLACFIGLSFGGLFTVSAPLVTEVFGLENFGKIFGLVFTAYGFLAGLLGPWLSGVLLDATGSSYKTVFSLFTVFYLISSALILRVKKEF